MTSPEATSRTLLPDTGHALEAKTLGCLPRGPPHPPAGSWGNSDGVARELRPRASQFCLGKDPFLAGDRWLMHVEWV